MRIVMVMCFGLLVVLLGACGSPDAELDGDSQASGTMLADQELPELDGVIQSVDDAGDVVITVDGEDQVFRLSADAKGQIENGEVSVGDSVTFTTYSIGDSKHTVDVFELN